MSQVPRSSDHSQSPLTDPRSLGVSAALHVVLLILASLAAFGAGRSAVPNPGAVLSAEIGPVDNRVPSGSGGGSPGEIGGTATSAMVRLSADTPPSDGTATRDPAASLLADAVPAPANPLDSEKIPLGPATTGVGLIAGTGSGGGGGSGDGSGGGVGKGIGPGTEFFGAQERASSFAYVIDCSGSMASKGALRIAKAELLNSLDRLPPDARFSVVFYNTKPTIFPDPSGNSALMSATIDNKDRAKTHLVTIRADGGTDHSRALRAAIALRPEAIFFLTDAERMDDDEARTLRAEAGSIRIQAIEFGDGPSTGGAVPLRNLATSTGGSFRHVDLSTLTQSK
ncbi:MAG: hypothetical protein JWN86_2145 [Planctomycetota bacterium]|nr:hypothetical protein [Planctomycetota bacterium]